PGGRRRSGRGACGLLSGCDDGASCRAAETAPRGQGGAGQRAAASPGPCIRARKGLPSAVRRQGAKARMAMAYKVAVIGATGNVGREMLQILAERDFPVSDVAALASASSVGREVSFGEDQVLKVQNLETFDFTGWDIAL